MPIRFRDSISSSSTSPSSTVPTASLTSSPSSPPLSCISTGPSRSATIPIASLTSSSPTSPTSGPHIVSDFNPTSTYHIPTHGLTHFHFHRARPLSILDLTHFLRHRRKQADSYADRKALKSEVRHLLTTHGSELRTDPVLTQTSDGKHSLMDPETKDVKARWDVPWSIWKPTVIVMGGENDRKENVAVWSGEWDPRSQEFEAYGASYRWRWLNDKDMVLEKEGNGTGRYIVAIVYVEVSKGVRFLGLRARRIPGMKTLGKTSASLLFDDRGVNGVLATATLMIALKRERQRRAILLSTI